jgi:hypothetical protein
MCVCVCVFARLRPRRECVCNGPELYSRMEGLNCGRFVYVHIAELPVLLYDSRCLAECGAVDAALRVSPPPCSLTSHHRLPR